MILWVGGGAAGQLTHGAFVALGVLAALLVFRHEKRRRGLDHDERLWVVTGLAVAGGAVGARLGTYVSAIRLQPEATFLEHLAWGNRSILGGLLGAYVAALAGKRLTGYRQRTGALFAPAVALGMAVGRLGCLLTEQPGTRTDLPWGVTVPASDQVAFGIPVGAAMHPSFGYEIGFHLVAFAVIWRLRDRLAEPADLFLHWLTAYAAFRFLVEFVRGSEVLWGGLTGPQLFLLVTLPLLGWRSLVALRRQRREPRRLTAAAPLLSKGPA